MKTISKSKKEWKSRKTVKNVIIQNECNGERNFETDAGSVYIQKVEMRIGPLGIALFPHRS